MAKNSKPYKRRKKRRSVLYAPISFLIICIALIFSVSVFFKITTIEVEGNSVYTADEIIEAAGVDIGDNLVTFTRSAITSRIYAALPYVDSVTVSKSYPNKLTITVLESAEVAYISDGSDYWVISENCKILSSDTDALGDGLIYISGLTIVSPIIGSTMSVDDADIYKLEYIQDVLTVMSDRNMLGDITEIDISSVSDLNFYYMGKYTVRLGTNDSLEYKMDLLESAMAKIDDTESGTFDLTQDNEVHFIPDS